VILYWIPFYYILKTFALLWLYLPNFRGAETVLLYWISFYYRLYSNTQTTIFPLVT
jgi:hypothetical protein